MISSIIIKEEKTDRVCWSHITPWIFASNFDVRWMVQKAESSNVVFKLKLHNFYKKILLALNLQSK